MNIFQALTEKKSLRVAGIMSGTSADAVDAVLVEITKRKNGIDVREIAFVSSPYPKGYAEFLLSNSLPGRGSVDILSQLNMLIAHFFADTVKLLAKKASIPLKSIHLIGSHGQTVHHIPVDRKLFGKKIRSTFQLGDPSVIAKLTGIMTVGDFRSGDVAVGGTGAPLVPYFDYLMFRSEVKNRLLANIGGIANITLLKRGCSANDVYAFDTGPGNMLIDGLMKRLYRGKTMDKNGDVARTGRINASLLAKLMKHRYFSRPLPKSTGREEFGKTMVDTILRNSIGSKKENIIATATEFTALSLYGQFTRFMQPVLSGEFVDEVIVSGGGSQNKMIMETLQKYFSRSRVMLSDDCGVSFRSKEAACFAVLAHQTIHNIPTNIPNVTGATRQTVLGKICV